MKKTYLLIVSLIAFTAFGLDYDKTDTYFNHLKEVNVQWKHYPDACPDGLVSFNSDQERISLHLQLVCQYLLDQSPAGLTSAQLDNRIELVGELRIYGNAGVFPTNHYHQVRTPYFVDNYNVHCAVGYMMHVSGNDELVANIRADHNYDYIENIKTEGIVEWADKYGFTVAELKWIQPGYGPTTATVQVGGGANGTVNSLYSSWMPGLYIGGNFDELNGLPCLNVGVYESGQLNCIGGGVDGEVVNVWANSSDVYAFGNIQEGGNSYPLAIFDGANWNYISIPSRPDPNCHFGQIGDMPIVYEVVIDHPTISDRQEIWQYHSSTGWDKFAEVQGEINDIEGSYERYYAGEFDSVYVYENMILDSSFAANNVFIYSPFDANYITLGSEISDVVYDMEFVGNTMYYSGSCHMNQPGSEVCISRSLNHVLQPVLTYDTYYAGFTDTFMFKDMDYDGDQTLHLGGYFYAYSMWGGGGQNQGKLDVISTSLYGWGFFDSTVNAIAYHDDLTYSGGEFMTNAGGGVLNHLAYTYSLGGGWDPIGEGLEVYPNPFNDRILVEGSVNGTEYSITDLSGKEVKKGVILGQYIEGLSELSTGTYVLRLYSGEVPQTAKIIKR